MTETKGYAALSATTPLEPFSFQLRDVGPHDVQLKILYCGVCHSDIHDARNEWKGSKYPLVPGHEIIGQVVAVGNKVTLFKIDEIVAVGAFVDSCRTCSACKNNEEQYCQKGLVMTFNSFDKHTQGLTYGGFSKGIVVDENYVIPIPDILKKENLASLAPLIDAGVTVYSPLKHWNIGPGKKVGILGIGGLGHLAVKMAHALGAHVVALTSTPEKLPDMKRLGADEAILTTDEEIMKKHNNSLDFILNTLPVTHDLTKYLSLLKLNGIMCIVGIPPQPYTPFTSDALIMQRKSLAGSLIGSIAEMKEMFEFCAQHGITSDVEIIPIQKINESFENIISKKVRYRYVIDLASLPS